MYKLKDNHLPRISMIYILLFLVCKMFTSWQHLIFIICLWNYSKHNNTYSLLIRLHSGHIFLFSFLNTYEICWRRSFVTKWTCQRLDVVSRIFKHQTSNRHDFSSVWSFHRYDNVRTGSHRKHEFYGQVSFTSEMYVRIFIVLGACLERTRRRAISFNQ